MKVFDNVKDLKNKLILKTGYSIGFVPTMGALHEGHLSLVRNSVEGNDITIVSIFVNPKQFNDSEDLKKYPRNTEKDIELLKNTGCDIVFTPSENEIYPDEDEEYFAFGYLEEVMEGKFRPGHFNGVAQVVSCLFRIIKPNNAYFGLKDFQQLAIVKKVTEMLDFSINIIACPIIREEDGLAMSSRNVLLSEEERRSAAFISKILLQARDFCNIKSVAETKKWVIDILNKIPHLSVEYFEIVDDTELKKVEAWYDRENIIGCIAVKAGNIRLIDNIAF